MTYYPDWKPLGPVIPVKAEVKLNQEEDYTVDQIGGCLSAISKWPAYATYELKLDALDLGTGQMERLDFHCLRRQPKESSLDFNYDIYSWAKSPVQMADIRYLRELREHINKIIGKE